MRNIKKTIKNCWTSVKEYYSLLKISWEVQARVFFEDSTLHGVRYVAEKGRPFIEKFMWLFCVGIGAITAAVIILNLWEKFQTNPTITGLDTDFHKWDVPFPGITVCQETPSNSRRVQDYLDQHANSIPLSVSKGDYEQFILMITKLNLKTIKQFTNISIFGTRESYLIKDDINLKNLSFSLMKHCEEIFDDCEWLGSPVNCCEYFHPVFTEKGFCYTFNSRTYEKHAPWSDAPATAFKELYIIETDLKWSFSFSLIDNDTQAEVYVLHYEETLDNDVLPHYSWQTGVIGLELSQKQTYTTDDARQLSRKQRHCTFPDEVKLKINDVYTYTTCTKQCRMDNAMEYCQCVPYFYDNSVYTQYKHCKLSQLKCIADNLESILNIDHCHCQLSCSYTLYEIDKMTRGTDVDIVSRHLEVEFNSWPMIRFKREVLFGWVDLLVSFGGIAGLFLGFSLLSGVEIIYYFTIRSIVVTIRERDELERIRYEKKSQPLIDYDLSLVPYWVRKPYPGSGLNQIMKSYYGDQKFLRRRRVAPMLKGGQWKTTDTIIPPFGIEFIN